MKQEGFHIGGLHIQPPTVLAPLAGITGLPFRLMVKDMGCGLVCSEMISSNGLVYDSEKTVAMLESRNEEKPLSVQIFGSDPDVMARAAERVQESGADILDINFGCSVKKVVKNGAGVALMKEPERAEQILKAVRKVLRIPLTIKIRSGWEKTGRQAFEIARIAEHCGVDALTFHPRTAGQRFSGHANWDLISEMKKMITIPLIGNGDIRSAEQAVAMIRDTGCDAVMIGRAALSAPSIFRETEQLLSGQALSPVSTDEHFAMVERYIERSVMVYGEHIACRMLRSRLGSLVRGLPGATRFRVQMSKISEKSEALDLIRQYREGL